MKRQKYEYLLAQLPVDAVEERTQGTLDMFGLEGWELVAVLKVPNEEGLQQRFYFKRSFEEEPDSTDYKERGGF